jgi:reverse gyrase
VIYHSPCCTCGGLSSLNLRTEGKCDLCLYSERRSESWGGIWKRKEQRSSYAQRLDRSGWDKSENPLQYITHFFIPWL